MKRYIRWFIRNGDYFYFDEKPIHTSGVSLDKSSISLTTVGQTEQLTATISPEGAVETKVVWSSSDETIATVDSTGLVTCVTPGECTITATCGEYSASCSIGVPKTIDFLLVGGGGGGGGTAYTTSGGGGGGGGGFINCVNYLINVGSYPVIIGAGGAGCAGCVSGCNGGNSSFNLIVAYGGGGGGAWNACGCNGGSGGGAGGYRTLGGSACSGQGYAGGAGRGGDYFGGGGGGGAGAVGGNYKSNYGGGDGGIGIQSDISGTAIYYSGGGGAGSCCYVAHGTGGNGGGGSNGNATYYGGGGGGAQMCCTPFTGKGFNGYQGVFILRYPTACGYDITGGTCYTCGNYTIHCFTSNGTLTVN